MLKDDIVFVSRSHVSFYSSVISTCASLTTATIGMHVVSLQECMTYSLHHGGFLGEVYFRTGKITICYYKIYAGRSSYTVTYIVQFKGESPKDMRHLQQETTSIPKSAPVQYLKGKFCTKGTPLTVISSCIQT